MTLELETSRKGARANGEDCSTTRRAARLTDPHCGQIVVTHAAGRPLSSPYFIGFGHLMAPLRASIYRSRDWAARERFPRLETFWAAHISYLRRVGFQHFFSSAFVSLFNEMSTITTRGSENRAGDHNILWHSRWHTKRSHQRAARRTRSRRARFFRASFFAPLPLVTHGQAVEALREGPHEDHQAKRLGGQL